MALSIDKNTVLRAIVDHPHAFPAIQVELATVAPKLLSKQLKATSTTLPLFMNLYSAIGAANMQLLFEGMAANEISGLLKKIDPHSAALKMAATDLKAARSHIHDLAANRVQPATKPEKAAKASPVKKVPNKARPKIGDLLQSEVHSGNAAPQKRAARKKNP